MRKKYRFVAVFMSLMLSLMMLYGCDRESSNNDTESSEIGSQTNTDNASGDEDLSIITDVSVDFKDADIVSVSNNIDGENVIKFLDNEISYNGTGADIESNVITIKKAGRYILTGNSNDSQVVVDATDDDKVELVLANVTLNSSGNSTILVKNADKVRVILADNSVNTITDNGEYNLDEAEDIGQNATIFSKTDLVITGSGTLNVEGNFNNGIVSKDDLIITSGNINVTAKNDGIKGKDSVRIKEGTISVTSGDDGIKSDNDEKSDKGYIYIENGTITISAEGDGIQADKLVKIEDGVIRIENSEEGIEAQNIIINDGDIWVNSKDDGINISLSNYVSALNGNSSNDSNMNGEQGFNRPGGPDFERDFGNRPNDMDFDKDNMPNRDDFDMNNIPNRDDFNMDDIPERQNGSSDNNQGFQGGPGGPGFPGGQIGGFETIDGTLTINGGYLYVNSAGDGLDSNGNIVQNGGVVIVEGPADNANGAIDYNGSYTMSGGTLIAVGSAGMAMEPSETSGVYGAMVNVNISENDIITFCNNDESFLYRVETSKKISNVVVYSDELGDGDECVVRYDVNKSQIITVK